MNRMERIKLGRGSTTTMGLAGMHCVRRCMCVFMLKSCECDRIWWRMCAGIENTCVFMLKSCDCARIWWQMCAGIENACVFMLKSCDSAGIWWHILCLNWECMYVFMLKPCNTAGIWWYIIWWNWKCMWYDPGKVKFGFWCKTCNYSVLQQQS